MPVGNGIEIHVGQFGTFNGYEAYDTYKDPNWSRSYGFFIESSAHTGIAAFYKINDMFAIQGGVGNAAGFNNEVNASNPLNPRKPTSPWPPSPLPTASAGRKARPCPAATPLAIINWT